MVITTSDHNIGFYGNLTVPTLLVDSVNTTAPYSIESSDIFVTQYSEIIYNVSLPCGVNVLVRYDGGCFDVLVLVATNGSDSIYPIKGGLCLDLEGAWIAANGSSIPTPTTQNELLQFAKTCTQIYYLCNMRSIY